MSLVIRTIVGKGSIIVGYIKDNNTAGHSVDSDKFYAVIDRSVRSKTYINLYFIK